MQFTLLEDALNDMAIIRTTLDTMMMFDGDDPIRPEILAFAFEARDNLTVRFKNLLENLQTSNTDYVLNYETFKSGALQMMTRGYSGQNLNSMMKVTAFDENATQNFYELTDLSQRELIPQMSGHQVAVLLLNDILHGIEDKDSYTDERQFNHRVFQKYLTILFLIYACTNPIFYGF